MPREQRGQGARRNKEGHVLAATGVLEEDAPAASKAARADAEAAVDLVAGCRVLAQEVGADPGPGETDAIVKESDEGAQEGRRPRR